MESNRYENVERAVRILDLRINKLLKDDKLNSKDLMILMEVRSTYVKELDGLTRSKNTHEMFKKRE